MVKPTRVSVLKLHQGFDKERDYKRIYRGIEAHMMMMMMMVVE